MYAYSSDHVLTWTCHKTLGVGRILQYSVSSDLALSVRPKPFPSFRPSIDSVRTHIFVMDFHILLSFYRNMYLHMRTAHNKYGCTTLTGNRVTALCYFQIYIVDSWQINLIAKLYYLNICSHVQSYKTRYTINISTDKLINKTNQLTYKLHLISLKNKDTLVLKSLFHYKNNPRI